MTTIYFIRHAQPNYDNHDDYSRELTEKGLQDCKDLVKRFEDIKIDALYSSPYVRAIDTIKPLAENRQKTIHLVKNFRERKIGNHWIKDFNGFVEKQWTDFSFRLSDGESLSQVQARNIQALETLLKEHPEQTLVVGSHGTALSAIINYYQPAFTYSDFQKIKDVFPWLITLQFDGNSCISIAEFQ